VRHVIPFNPKKEDDPIMFSQHCPECAEINGFHIPGCTLNPNMPQKTMTLEELTYKCELLRSSCIVAWDELDRLRVDLRAIKSVLEVHNII